MLKRSKSYFLFHYNDNLYIKTLKINKSLNDLSSLLLFEFNNKRKLNSKYKPPGNCLLIRSIFINYIFIVDSINKNILFSGSLCLLLRQLISYSQLLKVNPKANKNNELKLYNIFIIHYIRKIKLSKKSYYKELFSETIVEENTIFL
jgi:hypothetical protein